MISMGCDSWMDEWCVLVGLVVPSTSKGKRKENSPATTDRSAWAASETLAHLAPARMIATSEMASLRTVALSCSLVVTGSEPEKAGDVRTMGELSKDRSFKILAVRA